jgi:predicted O-methyltransferase YrrM
MRWSLRSFATEVVMTAAAWGRDLVVELYARYAPDLARLARFEALGERIGKSYAGEERRLLYLMTRHRAPELIVEFSPKRGWSTLHMAAALEDNGRGYILSFELEPVYAALTRRTLKEAGLAHRGEVVVGDVREEFPRVYGDRHRWRAELWLEFLFIDSDHSAPFADWYVGNVFPLVRQGGVIHVHDVEASPEIIAEGRTFHSDKPSGEEERLAAYLLARRECYRWFSVAALVRDASYLAAVRAHGGGEIALPSGRRRLHPNEARIGFERNPSLWIERAALQEQTHYPGLPFDPIVRSPLGRLRYAVRKRIAPAYASIREARRDRKLKRRPTPI